MLYASEAHIAAFLIFKQEMYKMKMKTIKKRIKKPPDVFAFNTSNAAKFLGCSEALLRKFRSLGEGPAYSKLGKKIVYPIPELKKYLKKTLVR